MKVKLGLCLGLLIGLAVSVEAHSLSTPAPERLFSLLKCTSMKHGTLWGSFGHLMRSGEDRIQYFPTELAVFGRDYSFRRQFPDWNEALKIDVVFRKTGFHLQFDAVGDFGKKTHLLQLIRVDPRIDNAFMGNWRVSTEDGEEIFDQVACSTG